MKCFEIQGASITPYIMVGRLHFVRVGKTNVPLDQSLIDSIPFFGCLKLKDARLESVGDKPTRILPADSIRTEGEAALVRFSLGLNERSKMSVTSDCNIWHGEKGEEVVVLGGPGPMGGGMGGIVRFPNYQALLTMLPGQSITLEETYEVQDFPGFFDFLKGVKPTTRQVTRRFTATYDGTTVRTSQSDD
ncbi:MAG: hypothetical protein IPP97_09600 [Candidatus Obscuribacter sp.]|jgi:hypothetical protein|nr:hypothetical protein [Candidatus Obscuribacter sp.]